MTPRIIAICGLKRSGKDTIADILCHNYDYEKVKIANPLKQALQLLFQFTDAQLEGEEKDIVDTRWGVKPRHLMQFIGTEVMQFQLQEVLPDVGRTFWIKRLIEEHITPDDTSSNKKIVISDLRFKHEYDLLVQHNAVFWRVERFQTKDGCDHSSEREYLDIPVDHVFMNTGSREHLEHLVKQKVEELVKSYSHTT